MFLSKQAKFSIFLKSFLVLFTVFCVSNSYAQIARKILETDLSSRTDEVKKFHNAWIGLTAPNFRMQQGTDSRQRVSLNQYDDPRISEIITAAVKAHGGLKKLQAVENIVMNASLFEYFPDDTSEME